MKWAWNSSEFSKFLKRQRKAFLRIDRRTEVLVLQPALSLHEMGMEEL